MRSTPNENAAVDAAALEREPSVGDRRAAYTPNELAAGRNDVPQAHPICLLLPDMAPDDYARLKADVARLGLLRQILLHDGKILDGRHRARACDELGINARYKSWSGADPLAYVLSENLHRRHLTPSQKAMIAARTIEWHRAAAQSRQKAGGNFASRDANATPATATSASPDANPLISGKAAGTAAAAAGVSARSVERAIKIQTQGTPADVRAVIEGISTVNGKAREIAARQATGEARDKPLAAPQGPTAKIAMQRAMAVSGALAELRRVDSALLLEDADRLVGELEAALVRYRAMQAQAVADA